jgi:hypothetical protein
MDDKKIAALFSCHQFFCHSSQWFQATMGTIVRHYVSAHLAITKGNDDRTLIEKIELRS